MQASKPIALRIFSKAGRSRVDIAPNESFISLKREIEKKLNVPADKLKLFSDEKYTKAIIGRDTDALDRLRLINGAIIYVQNEDAAMNLGTTGSGFAAQPKEEKKQEPHKEEMINTKTNSTTINTKVEEPEKKDTASTLNLCRHGPNAKCVNCLGVTKDNAKDVAYQCKHSSNERCPNCPTEKNYIKDTKHVSFEHYINELKSKCKNKHPPTQKCQNCVPLQALSYKLKKGCGNHRPFPEGVCNQCMPPTATLKRQEFRHVDYVSFMNFEEIQGFVNYWQKKHCMEQRVGFLYGYYSEDPNYPEGVRVNIEAIYEPPQVGEINGVTALEDSFRPYVDLIAESLSLERVGWIFTSINNDAFLTSHEVRRIAQLQEQHLVTHPEGYKVSKFVTVLVRPKGDGEHTAVECYMVSDQCQALERDNVFGDSESRKKMVVRKPKSDEMVPTIMLENKPGEEFEPDFFIVSLAYGQPKKKNFNIIKNYDFPPENRDNTRSKEDLKKFYARHKGEETWKKFSNFHYLLYIAEMLDIDTAQVIAKNIAEEQKLEPTLTELIESLGR